MPEVTVIPYSLIVGSVVRFHRRRQGLFIRDVEGAASATIGHCELGTRSLTCSSLWKVAKALGMTFEHLIRDCEKVEKHLLKKGKPDKEGVLVNIERRSRIAYAREETEKALQRRSI